MRELDLSSESFRATTGRYATGVAVVTATVDGIDHAMTTNSFTSLSLDPLLVLFCVERDSRFHEAITATASFSISVLPASAQPAARWFAERGRPLIDQFSEIPHVRGVQGSPLLSAALCWIECSISQIVTAGDHDIVIGAVEHLLVSDDDDEPLVFWKGRFRALPGS
ncbi:MAG: flavin reductase family protein [Candidatus Nanopelagicales bacterium]|nr:flavin reductase family protein [Candidatus Nanopelagicales bacterium]